MTIKDRFKGLGYTPIFANSKTLTVGRNADSIYLLLVIFFCKYLKQSGAEVARLAHNQEDTGSKPVFAIINFFY